MWKLRENCGYQIAPPPASQLNRLSFPMGTLIPNHETIKWPSASGEVEIQNGAKRIFSKKISHIQHPQPHFPQNPYFTSRSFLLVSNPPEGGKNSKEKKRCPGKREAGVRPPPTTHRISVIPVPPPPPALVVERMPPPPPVQRTPCQRSPPVQMEFLSPQMEFWLSRTTMPNEQNASAKITTEVFIGHGGWGGGTGHRQKALPDACQRRRTSINSN